MVIGCLWVQDACFFVTLSFSSTDDTMLVNFYVYEFVVFPALPMFNSRSFTYCIAML